MHIPVSGQYLAPMGAGTTEASSPTLKQHEDELESCLSAHCPFVGHVTMHLLCS